MEKKQFFYLHILFINLKQMYNGLFPNDPFGFLLEFPQIILSLDEIDKLMSNQYQQIQNNFEILFSLYNNHLGNSKDNKERNYEMLNIIEKNDDSIQKICLNLINEDNKDRNYEMINIIEKNNSDSIQKICLNLINKDDINKEKTYFKVSYRTKNKKRKYQVDCMTKKLNVNFFKYLKQNKKELNIDKNILNFFKKNMKLTSRTIIEQLKKKCPKLNEYFQKFLQSNIFKHLMDNIKQKNDEEYSTLFIKHVKNYQRIINENIVESIKNENVDVNNNCENILFDNNKKD